MDPYPASQQPPVPARPDQTPRAWRTPLCWALAAPGLAWAAVRLAGLEPGPVVPLLAFTPYVAVWTPVPLLVALALRRWWPAGAAALALLVLAVAVLPRALPDGRPAGTGPVLRVMTANLLAGAADPDAVLALVRRHRVEVLAVQEFTPDAEAALDRLGLADLLPHRQVNPEPGTTGSGLYARFSLVDGGTRRNAGGFTQSYATLAVPGAGPVLVESVHPLAPYAIAALPDWRADLRAQPSADPAGPPRILAGDFNATLDHVLLRQLLATGYVDAAASTGAGLAGTWGPYDGNRIPPVVIDHVLVDRRIGVRDAAVRPLPGSDHRAVVAELVLPAG
nr:endonuclease/exonuclease/phosphatase family protein [Micromonospora sp. DSM 115978]